MNRILYSLSLFLMSVLILSLLSCEVKKKTIALEEEEVYFEEPHILFLTCAVTVDNDKSTLEIEDKILIKGKLKLAHMDTTSPKVGDWVVTVVDAFSNVLLSTRLDDPLLYRAEYVNEEGVLETILIERELGVLSVRIPIEGYANQVIIKRKTFSGFKLMLQIKTAEL